MKKELFIAVLILLAPFAATSKLSAQASLQPGASGIQSQTGQTQTTNTNLNQTGRVQTNNGNQSYLNQSSLRPLGVVSSPTDSSPQVIAQPSSNLRTEVTKPTLDDGSNLLVRSVAFIAVLGTVLGIIYLWRMPRSHTHTPEQSEDEEVIITPAEAEVTLKKKSKKDKRSRKQRRKNS